MASRLLKLNKNAKNAQISKSKEVKKIIETDKLNKFEKSSQTSIENNVRKPLLFSLIIILLIFLLSIPCANAQELDEIYDSLEEAPFEYIFGLDPKQSEEYTKYIYSPYPLFRSGVNLVFKSKVIPAGYYLLTPREKDGKTYILFKENGRVKFAIPVYKTAHVYEGFYEDKLPSVDEGFVKKSGNKFMNFIGTKWGHKNKRTPIPKAYIEFNDSGIYWDMVLYYGDKKYYLVFKKE